MKEQTNKELAQRAMDRYHYLTQLKNGRKDYWWDREELNRAFFEGLRKQKENAAYLYWLAGSGNQISPEQEKELQGQLTYNNDTVIIPLNHGDQAHWDFTVLERNANGVWQAYKVDNVGVAGQCGKRTVGQALTILKVGVATFAEQNPGLVRKVDAQDAIYQPVQRILNKVNSVDYALAAGIAESKRFLRNQNPFEYELAKMAHSELALQHNNQDSLTKQDLQKSQAVLTKMFTSMTPQEQEFTINRLIGSGLSQKSSVSKIIDSLLVVQNNAVKPVPPVSVAPVPASAKLSANANCLLKTDPKANSRVVSPEPAAKPALRS
jgi:hypothetical protein